MEEQYTDAYSNPLQKGFYRNRNNGGIFRVKTEERGQFVLIDSAVPGRKFGPTQYITSNLVFITNPQQEIKSLREHASWLESQLEDLANEKTGGN